MSNAITSATPASLQALSRTILQNFDANADGQFSLDEFSSFLNTFMKSVGGAASNGASGAVQTTPIFAALTAAPAALPACPPGWNAEKWVNPSHNTVKYVAGRIMARHSPSEWVDPATREQILSEFRAAGLEPTASGKDKCDFNDGAGPIDIVQAASEGGRAWQWLSEGLS